MGYWDVIEPHWDRLNSARGRGPEGWARAVAEGPADVVLLYSAYWCFSEVGNGGLAQFFSNSAGALAPEAVEGLRAVGMPEAADLLAAAAALLGEPYPRDRDQRSAALDDLLSGEDGDEEGPDDPFEALEDRFWDLMQPDQGEGFEERADAWVARS